MQVRLRNLLSVILMGPIVVGACSAGTDGSATDKSVLPPETAVDVNADVPDDFVAAVLEDVVARTGLTVDQLTLLDSTAVEWADQRLGCVHFDEPSVPKPVDGYRVVVDSGDTEFDYRLDAAGTYELCGDPVDTLHGVPDDGDNHDEDTEDDITS